MKETDSYVYQFGPYRLEPGKGLSRAGSYVPIPPKELATLETLVHRRGEIVSQEELWDNVWPNREASYDSITRCIYVLRRTLGGSTQQYITTVPRKGYRLASPVKLLKLHSRPSLIEKSINTSQRAYAHFLEGLREANLTGQAHQRRAIELFEEACLTDASYAVPLGAIADCRMYQLIRCWITPQEGRRSMLDACTRALAIDSELVSALAARGWIEGVVNRDTDLGLRFVDNALELDPNCARAYAYRGWVLRGAGRLRESIDAVRMAVDLDPHSVLNAHALAWSLFCAGQPEEALAFERKMALETSWLDIPHCYVALMGSWFGHEDEALTAGYRAVEISDSDPQMLAVLAFALARLGHVDEACSLAARAEAAQLPRASRAQLATIYAQLGDRERVISLLKEARDERCPWFPGARYDPRLGNLAHDPAVQRLYNEDSIPADSNDLE